MKGPRRTQSPTESPRSRTPGPRPLSRLSSLSDQHLAPIMAAGGRLSVLGYLVATWSQPHRALMLAVVATVVLGGVIAGRADGRLRGLFEGVAPVAIIGVLALIDGPTQTPLFFFLFPSVAVNALIKSRRVALLTAGVGIATMLVGAGLMGWPELLRGTLGALALAFTSVIGIRQSAAQARRQQELQVQRDASRDAEARFRSGFDGSLAGMALADPAGRFIEVNEALAKMLGRPREELVGLSFREISRDEERELDVAALARFHAGEIEHFQREKLIVRPDGEHVWVAVAVTAVRAEDGDVSLLQAQVLDVTAQRRARRQEQRRAAQQAVLAELSQRALLSLQFTQLVSDAAASVADVLELETVLLEDTEAGPRAIARHRGSGDALAGFTDAWRQGRQGRGRFEPVGDVRAGDALGVWLPALDGEPARLLAVRAPAPAAFAGDEPGFLAAVANVLAGALQREAVERELRWQSMHDPLTGLPNRNLLLHRLERALSRAGVSGEPLAMLFLDVDHFKTVNDVYGHNAGDELLRVITDRMLERLRPTDTLARFGGDEFVVLCAGVGGEAEVAELARRLLGAFERPVELSLGGRPAVEHHCSASIGVCIAGPQHRDDPELLIRDADTAMYRAKHDGRGRFEIFEPTTRARVVARLRLTDELREAVGREQLSVAYQPLVSLQTGAVRSVEALVRWNHPERGPIPPSEFIVVAEETGLIEPLGRWVREHVAAQLVAWNAQPARELQGLSCGINVSAREIVEGRLPDAVMELLERHRLAPSRLVCEITETALIDDPIAAATNVDRLTAAGVPVALDDFCTGYSALGHLKTFKLAAIKLDRTFVAGVGDDAVDMAIVSSLVKIAQAGGLVTVAEGVETPEQLALVHGLGCDRAQGFLFSKPLPAPELAAFLRGFARNAPRLAVASQGTRGRAVA